MIINRCPDSNGEGGGPFPVTQWVESMFSLVLIETHQKYHDYNNQHLESMFSLIGADWNPPTMIKTTRTYPEEFESRRLILNYEKSEYLARGGCPTKNPIAKRYFLLTFDELQKNVNILLIHLNIDNLWKLQSKSVNCWLQWVSGHCRKWTLWLVNHHIFCTTKKPVSWSLPDVTGTKSCNGSLCPGLEICLGTTANVYKKNTNKSLSVSE